MKLSKEDKLRLAAIRSLMKLNDELQEEKYSQSTVQTPVIQPSWMMIKFLVDVIDKLIG